MGLISLNLSLVLLYRAIKLFIYYLIYLISPGIFIVSSTYQINCYRIPCLILIIDYVVQIPGPLIVEIFNIDFLTFHSQQKAFFLQRKLTMIEYPKDSFLTVTITKILQGGSFQTGISFLLKI